MAEILNQVLLEEPAQPLTEDQRGQLEFAVDRTRARQQAQGQPFSQHKINARLRNGAYRDLMHQRY
ncbi:MAG: hypothetical protein AB3X44_21715 [Leptothrix sp. (in: b-proteobacteria)]